MAVVTEGVATSVADIVEWVARRSKGDYMRKRNYYSWLYTRIMRSLLRYYDCTFVLHMAFFFVFLNVNVVFY
jgi:hypothetical protein